MQSSIADKFRVGLVQMSCALDPNQNLEKALWKIREAAAGGAQIVCLQELFRSQYFCREENAELFALAESIPGPSTDTLGKLARELEIVIIASLVRAARRGRLSQHRRGDWNQWRHRRPLSQDAHPRRPAVFREVLLHAGRSRLRQFRHCLRPPRRPGLLGPVVSGSGAPFEPRRREYSFLSHRHRLASGGKRAVRRGAVGCLANHPALACHRQRDLRCGRESRRLRRAARSRIANSGDLPSSPIRSAESSPKRRPPRKTS